VYPHISLYHFSQMSSKKAKARTHSQRDPNKSDWLASQLGVAPPPRATKVPRVETFQAPTIKALFTKHSSAVHQQAQAVHQPPLSQAQAVHQPPLSPPSPAIKRSKFKEGSSSSASQSSSQQVCFALYSSLPVFQCFSCFVGHTLLLYVLTRSLFFSHQTLTFSTEAKNEEVCCMALS
jgi:hypothetical protein